MRRSWCRTFLSRAAVAGVVLAFAGAASEPSALAQGAPKGQPAKGQPAKGPAKGDPARAKAKPGKPKSQAQKEADAAKFFEEGKNKLDSGDFLGAYEAFKSADAEVSDPPVPKFKMAEALDKGGDVEGAIKAYENFLAAKPRPKEDAKRIEAATSRIAALKIAPADVKVVISPPEAAAALLSIDGAPAQGNPLKVPVGKHTITASLAGFDDARVEVEVTRGEKKEVSILLVAKAKDPSTPDPITEKPPEKPPEKPKNPETSSGSSIIPAAVTLSLAGAGVVVGAVFGGLALKSKGEYEETPTQDLFDETERNALIADMSFGVALTFGVTGVVLLLTDSGGAAPEGKEGKPAEPKPTARVLPYGGPGGAGVVGHFTF